MHACTHKRKQTCIPMCMHAHVHTYVHARAGEASFGHMISQCDTTTSRLLLFAAATARTRAPGTSGLKGKTKNYRGLGCGCTETGQLDSHEHLVDSLLAGLCTEFARGSGSAVFFRELIMSMSLADIVATLELLQDRALEDGFSCGSGGCGGGTSLQGRPGVEILARAAQLMFGSGVDLRGADVTAERRAGGGRRDGGQVAWRAAGGGGGAGGKTEGSGGEGGEGYIIRVSRELVDTSVSFLVHTAAMQGYLSLSLEVSISKIISSHFCKGF